MSGQFGTSAEVSRGHFGTGTELSRPSANIFATIGRIQKKGLILLLIIIKEVYTRIHRRGLAIIFT